MGEKNAPLPKFGEWDVKNPAAAKDFSVIFDKARNAKRDGGRAPSRNATRRDQLDSPTRQDCPNSSISPSTNTPGGAHFLFPGKSLTGRKWLCCVGRRRHTD
nr:RPM1-interacting protein 4 [Ipomoea batatas]